MCRGHGAVQLVPALLGGGESDTGGDVVGIAS